MRRVCSVLLIGILAAFLASAVCATDPAPVPTPVPIVVEGLITTVTITGTSVGTITVQVPSPTPTTPVRLVTFSVTDKTQLFLNGKKVGLGDIKQGYQVRALCTKTSSGTLVAQIVYATIPPPPPLKWASGLISDKSLYNGVRTFKIRAAAANVTTWFSVDANTKITVDGQPATYDKLAVGQPADVGFVAPPPTMTPVVLPILASVVNAKNPPPPPVIHVIGRLAKVDLDNKIIYVLLPGASAAVTFKISDATTIDKFGPVGLGDLVAAGPYPGYPGGFYTGDMLDVLAKPAADTTTPPVASAVVVLPETFMGVVASRDPVLGTVLVIPRTVASPVVTVIDPTLGVLFSVVPATKIMKDGLPSTLDKLAKGDSANVKFFQFKLRKVASLIEARSSTVPPPTGGPQPL